MSLLKGRNKDNKAGPVVERISEKGFIKMLKKGEAVDSLEPQKEFIKEYQALCKRLGWQLIAVPALKPMNDLGGQLIVAQLHMTPYREGR